VRLNGLSVPAIVLELTRCVRIWPGTEYVI
jgi:hypothetical protein